MDRDGVLLEDGLRDVLDFVIGNGVHGVFVLGSSGEIFGLTDDQKRRVIEITVDQVGGRVPIYAGASEITTRDAIKTAQMIQEVGGVSAVSVLTPYFLTPNQAELKQHYRTIASSVDLPVILYGNPGKTQVKLELPTVVELAEVDNIIAIKDSSGDMTLMADYIRATPDDFTVLAGRDTLIFSGLVHGAKGAIASCANIAPRLMSQIYESFVAGDYDRALELQFSLAPLRGQLDKATFPVVLKEGLRLVGVEAGYCLAPAGDLSDDQRNELASVISSLLIPSER